MNEVWDLQIQSTNDQSWKKAPPKTNEELWEERGDAQNINREAMVSPNELYVWWSLRKCPKTRIHSFKYGENPKFHRLRLHSHHFVVTCLPRVSCINCIFSHVYLLFNYSIVLHFSVIFTCILHFRDKSSIYLLFMVFVDVSRWYEYWSMIRIVGGSSW